MRKHLFRIGRFVDIVLVSNGYEGSGAAADGKVPVAGDASGSLIDIHFNVVLLAKVAN